MDGSDHYPYKVASAAQDSNSTTQSLLFKPYPTLQSSIASVSETEEDQTQYLQISYNYGPRSFKDLPFLILFLVLVICTFGFGIFSSFHKNPHRYQVSSFIYNTTLSSCTLQLSNSSDWRIFYENMSEYSALNNNVASLNALKSSLLSRISVFDDPDSFNPLKSSLLYSLIDYLSFTGNPTTVTSSRSSLLNSLIWTLVITLILSVPFVLSVLILLKHYTKQIVYALLPFFVIVPVFINVYWFVACTVSSSCSDNFPLAYRILVLIFIFLIIAVILWIFILNWHRIELTAEIIGVASNALSKNLGLFGLLPTLILGLFVYYVPIVVFIIFSSSNGRVVPKEESEEYHCIWKQDSWVPAYFTLAILTMLWSATVMVEAQVYLISGTISLWYFSKDDSGPKRGMRSSLRNAFGPSFGSICLSGLVMGMVSVVRSMVDNARQEDASGVVNIILRCFVSTFLSAVDFLNKFTINFISITGEAYCSAARMTYELLKRNLLSAVIVEIVSTRILAGIIFVLSAIYAVVVCVILKAGIRLGNDAYFVALMAWILLIVVLGFFVHVLDNVIDTVYICYAIDRDRGDVSKQEVHNVYVHLPISRSHRTGFAVRAPPVV